MACMFVPPIRMVCPGTDLPFRGEPLFSWGDPMIVHTFLSVHLDPGIVHTITSVH